MSAAKIFWTILVLAQILSTPVVHTASSACITPNGHQGNCVLLWKCPALRSIKASRWLPKSTTTMLNALKCGPNRKRRMRFKLKNSKVCCSPSLSSTIYHSSKAALSVKSIPSTSTFSRDLAQPENLNSEALQNIKNHHNLRLLPANCGVAIDEDRILGGNRTKIFEFPWMTLLYYVTDSGKKFGCGGTIINERYILTAAHCVMNLGRNELVSVRVGDHDINNEVDCDLNNPHICAPSYQDIGIEKAIPHPDFSGKHIPGRGRSFQNDIALIRLYTPIDMTKKNVMAVCLPMSHRSYNESQKFVVAGWGITDNGISSSVLLKVAIPYFPNHECGIKLNSSTADGIDDFRQICGGGVQGQDACSGDSGGPLMQPLFDRTVIYVQYGVISFGARDCGHDNVQNVPGVYTRVSYYIKWILNTIRP